SAGQLSVHPASSSARRRESQRYGARGLRRREERSHRAGERADASGVGRTRSLGAAAAAWTLSAALPSEQSVQMSTAEALTVRVVKSKWDGSVSAVDNARPLEVPGDARAWFVGAGSERQRPGSASIDVVASDELWVAVPGEW